MVVGSPLPAASTPNADGAAVAIPINILIVDDEPANLTVLETILDRPDYRLVRAESADSALLALVADEFALIILDIRMPGMSGIELAQLIKARRRSAHIPIIFLTAYFGDDEHALKGYDSGAVDYLHKPVNVVVLRSKVEVFADLHRKRHELALANSALLAEVAERRRAEEQLVEFNRTLEERIRERTQALHANEARLRFATDAAQLGIWSWQPDRDELFWENAWPYATFGLPAAAGPMSVSGCIAALVHPEDQPAFADLIRAAGERRGRVVFEGRLVLPDLGERWVEVIGQPMGVSESRSAPLFGTARDITDRKRAERELREADVRKDFFLATLAHELRNPLAPIRTAAHILEMTGAPAESLEASRAIIARQVSHMSLLLDDLLDISRVSRGKFVLKRSLFELGSALEEAIESAQPLIAAKAHHMRYEPPTALVRLDADRVRMIQVVTNLLTNAAKYTPRGGQITLAVVVDEFALQLSVRDNGIGIAPDMLPRVFDMFSQVSDSPRPAEGGLGIGLALARGIVDLHGGEIKANSPGLGQGSEFTVFLPRNSVHFDLAPESSAGIRLPEPTRPRRVLIADDNQDAATSLMHFLALKGHRVSTVSTGSEALSRALRERPEVLVLDIGMPDFSGYEIARRVRHEAWGFGATLIAVTGFGQERDRRDAFAAGFDHHLTKPIDPATLERLLAATAASGLMK
jgi:signal transduction histidine kinase/DNA-binding response OmpR family regulator